MNIDRYVRTAATTAILAACLVLSACSERVNREDFAQQLKNKTEPEVLKYAGKPDAKDDQRADRHVWTYKHRTFDVQNKNKFDDKTLVIFSPSSEGKLAVSDVTFE